MKNKKKRNKKLISDNNSKLETVNAKIKLIFFFLILNKTFKEKKKNIKRNINWLVLWSYKNNIFILFSQKCVVTKTSQNKGQKGENSKWNEMKSDKHKQTKNVKKKKERKK